MTAVAAHGAGGAVMTDLAARLSRGRACDEAVGWAESSRYISLRAAWNLCPRGDWLAWLAWQACVPAEAVRTAAFVVADRAVREYAADALDRAGFGWHADRLRAFAPMGAGNWRHMREACRDAYAAADTTAADAAYADTTAATAAAYAAAYAAAAYAAAARDRAQAAHDLRTVLTWDVVAPYVTAWLEGLS